MERIRATIGVFAGIIDRKTGRLLIVQREEDPLKGHWDLPGGGVEDSGMIPYDHLSRELEREIREEVGMELHISSLPAFFPVLIKSDLALVTVVVTPASPTRGNTRWVSVRELNELAAAFVKKDKEKGIEGKEGLVSGIGKRMHCMALAAFSHSTRGRYASAAGKTFADIQRAW